jgi:hypothetical protein
MAKQWYEIWFNDGDRYLMHGRKELRLNAERFDFDAETVIREKGCSLIDDEGHQVGGVQLIVYKHNRIERGKSNV